MKPIRTKPMLYAYYLGAMQERARMMGYNLVLHGSLQRDCDLIAIPWIDNPDPHFELIKALDMIIRDMYSDDPKHYLYSVLPGGRHSYVINIDRGGWSKDDDAYRPDPQFYLDISVTPFPEQKV